MSQPSPLAPAWQRARALVASGDLAGGRAVLEQAMEVGRAKLGEDDPAVLRTAYELALVLQRADDPVAARRVLEEAYAAGQWRLGDSDPVMLEISHDLGVVAEELANRHEARKAFARVAELGPAALGADHPAVVRARAYLNQDQDPFPVRPENPPPPPVSFAERVAQRAPDPVADPFRPEPPTVPFRAPVHDSQGTSFQTARPDSPAPLPFHAVPDESPTAHFRVADPEPPTVPFQPVRPDSAVPFQSPPPYPDAEPEPATMTFGAVPQVAPEQQQAQQGQQGQPTWAGDGPTSAYNVITPTQGRGSVEPPPTLQPIWTPPVRNDALGGPTIAQPVITPYTAPQFQPPAQRAPLEAGSMQHGPRAPMQGGVPQSGPVPQIQRPLIPAQRDGEVARPAKEQRRHGAGWVGAIAGVLATVIAAVALVFVLVNNHKDDPAPNPSVPILAGKPPSGVTLDDEGTQIVVRWQDPTDGKVSFMVTMGHPGEELRGVGTLGPGATSFLMSSLNPGLQYCFTVVAVYSGSKFATSPQTCTKRVIASATPK